MDEPQAHRAQPGDEAAFRALYRAAHPGLLRYLRVLVGERGLLNPARGSGGARRA